MVNSAKKSSRSISPSSPQSAIICCDFALDGGGVALHLLAAQRGVVQHLLAALRAGVEHHALAEDRRHERVRLGLVQILVGGPEEELVGFAPDRKMTCLSPAGTSRRRRTRRGPAASARSGRCGTPRGGRALPRHPKRAARSRWSLSGIPSSPSVSCWRSFGALASGASGCSSMFATKPPRGVSATNVMARARSAARRK